MSAAARPGRRPGRPPSLTRVRIARAALAERLDTLSMPSVARRLGVSHSTLYRYVDDRHDLVLAALDLAVSEYEWPSADLDWRPLLESFTDAMWDFLAGRPGTAGALMTMAGPPPAVLELMRVYGRRLCECGLGPRDAMVALDFLAEVSVSSALGMAGLDDELGGSRAGSGGSRTRRDAYRDAFGELADIAPQIAAEETWRGRGWLDDKVAIMLDGLELRIASGASTGDPPSGSGGTRGRSGRRTGPASGS